MEGFRPVYMCKSNLVAAYGLGMTGFKTHARLCLRSTLIFFFTVNWLWKKIEFLFGHSDDWYAIPVLCSPPLINEMTLPYRSCVVTQWIDDENEMTPSKLAILGGSIFIDSELVCHTSLATVINSYHKLQKSRLLTTSELSSCLTFVRSSFFYSELACRLSTSANHTVLIIIPITWKQQFTVHTENNSCCLSTTRASQGTVDGSFHELKS